MAKKKHREYNNNFGSVTQILNVLAKPALLNWFKYNTPQFCDAESKRGKEIGIQIHSAIEQNIEETEVKIETIYAEEVSNALKSFMLFKKEHPEFKLKHAELQMTSKAYGVNGTLDCIGSIEGQEVIFDWKSSQARKNDIPVVYDEYVWQCSAYCKLYEKIYDKKIFSAFVLVLAKDKVAYNLQEISMQDVEDTFKNVFLPCLKIYNYRKKK